VLQDQALVVDRIPERFAQCIRDRNNLRHRVAPFSVLYVIETSQLLGRYLETHWPYTGYWLQMNSM